MHKLCSLFKFVISTGWHRCNTARNSSKQLVIRAQLASHSIRGFYSILSSVVIPCDLDLVVCKVCHPLVYTCIITLYWYNGRLVICSVILSVGLLCSTDLSVPFV